MLTLYTLCLTMVSAFYFYLILSINKAVDTICSG